MINISHYIITQYIYQPSCVNIKDCHLKIVTTNLDRYFTFLYNPRYCFLESNKHNGDII